MKQRQRGMTFLGIVTILVILGAAVYGGIRAVPVYLEYMEVSRAMEQVKDEHAAIETSITTSGTTRKLIASLAVTPYNSTETD